MGQAPPPRGLGAIEVSHLVEKDPEVERGIVIPPLLRALVRRRRGSELAPLVKQHAQVERTLGFPYRVGQPIGQLGVGETDAGVSTVLGSVSVAHRSAAAFATCAPSRSPRRCRRKPRLAAAWTC